MTKDEILTKAREFCQKHGIDSYPVNIVELCVQQGISVFEKYLPKDVSGFIVIQDENFKDYKCNKLIVVNLLDPASRRRFNIAHELAHYILHKKSDDSLFAHRDAGQNGGIETEANIFASNILMPRDVVESAISEVGSWWQNALLDSDKIDYIAEKFAVSNAAAKVCLEQLNQI